MEWTALGEAERAELWRRWQAGEALVEISRGLGRPAPTVYQELCRRGGFAPRPRRRAAQQLRAGEREEISRGLARASSLRQIARLLGRAPSTVSREVRRHGGGPSYRAAVAEARAWVRARRPKPCKLALHPRLRALVARQLSSNWSPQQISGWLRRRYRGRPSMQVSHETIYRSLFIQARGVLKRELLRHLRAGHRYRLRRGTRRRMLAPEPIPAAVSIRERPAEAADRAVPGHWEGDLITGRHNSHIATLVERQARYLLLVKVTDRRAPLVARALARKIRRLPLELRRSLTWDRGSEMAAHQRFTLATDVQVYFCDPQSPWQRGSNENTNGLLRQYFPKGTDLSQYSQRHLDAVAKQMNQRPRKTLGFKNPAEVLAEALR